MKKFILKLVLGIFTLSFSMFTSCNKEELVDDTTSDIVDKASFSLDSSTNTGKFGCFELVFPVTFSLPDGSTKTVNSDEELKATLKSWVGDLHKKGKKCDSLRPKLVLPITVLTEAGEAKTITTDAELKALKDSCRKDNFDKRGPKDHAKKGAPCFKLNFPLTVLLPDSTTQVASDAQALKTIAKTWKQNNPNSKSCPTLVFPLTVTKKDGTTATVNSKEELKALRTSCD